MAERKGTNQAFNNTSGRGRPKKTPDINLHSLDDDAEPKEAGEVAQKHLQAFITLRNMLSTCTLHAKGGKMCKINKYGAHVILDTYTVKIWASSLVSSNNLCTIIRIQI